MKIEITWIKLFCAFVFICLRTSCASASDFKITAPSNWKLTQTSFPGLLYKNTSSKNNQMILVYVRDSGPEPGMNPGQLTEPDVINAVSRLREEKLASLGVEDYAIASAEAVRFGVRHEISGLQIESRYVGLEDQDVFMIERQYFVGNLIYNVVYREESEFLQDRARTASVLDQFVPNIKINSRTPASEITDPTNNSMLIGKAYPI